MNRSVEQALINLIPRHNGPLPPELIELASSLLAQSRNQASNLKAEEEIGRTYVCANIACERLKQALDLPKIEPRPPCPPRIYNKLYKYFDDILVVRRSTRPPKPTPAALERTKPLPSRPTPTKAVSLAPYKPTSGRAASSRRRGLQYTDSTKEIAPWIHPAIRGLCKELESPAAAPHILAGVTTILTLPSPSSCEDRDNPKEDKKDKIPALIAAVYFFVGARLSGRETNGLEYKAQRNALISTLGKFREDEEFGNRLRAKTEGGTEWQGWEKVGTKDVDGWLLEISTQGWLTLDWFENITEGAGFGVPNESDQLEDDAGPHIPAAERVGLEGATALQTGLGTMMQDRVDFLSEQRRADYKIWKRGILARMREIESQEAQEAMDTSDG